LDISQITALGIVAAILVVVLRQQRPEWAIQVGIVTGIAVFLMLASKIKVILDMLRGFSDKAGIDTVYFLTLLKIVGIAYISEFGAEICRDAGETSIGSKIELAARVIIVALAVPIMSSLVGMIMRIMPH